MADDDNAAAHAIFAFLEPAFTRVAGALSPDAGATMTRAREHFAEMAPHLAYGDNPGNPMAIAVFSCASSLSLHLALRDRGVNDVHGLGRALHEEFAKMPFPVEGLTSQLIESADRSQQSAAPGEFVFDVAGSAGSGTWEMNIRSCAICALYSQYDAMDLVPYMCALDDLGSDMAGQGLRRTGTIALGADHCDFRYHAGGEPLRLVDQYPQQVQLRT